MDEFNFLLDDVQEECAALVFNEDEPPQIAPTPLNFSEAEPAKVIGAVPLIFNDDDAICITVEAVDALEHDLALALEEEAAVCQHRAALERGREQSLVHIQVWLAEIDVFVKECELRFARYRFGVDESGLKHEVFCKRIFERFETGAKVLLETNARARVDMRQGLTEDELRSAQQSLVKLKSQLESARERDSVAAAKLLPHIYQLSPGLQPFLHWFGKHTGLKFVVDSTHTRQLETELEAATRAARAPRKVYAQDTFERTQIAIKKFDEGLKMINAAREAHRRLHGPLAAAEQLNESELADRRLVLHIRQMRSAGAQRRDTPGRQLAKGVPTWWETWKDVRTLGFY